MANFKIDLTKELGPIKPLHGVGQSPFLGLDFSIFRYLTEAGMPFSRLHDVYGLCGGNRYVDIPNLFRDIDADPTDPRSYDFNFTDLLMEALVEHHIEPFFRLGVTIENSSIKAYRIFPPADPQKWAVICEHVIRHYTEGWADGHHYNIRYWEIWNEPDDPDMWKGSMEEYFELYKRKTQVVLKTDADGIYAVAAKGDDSVCIVIANPFSAPVLFDLELDKKIDKCYLLDKNHLYEEVTCPKAIGEASVLCIIAK